MKNIILIKLLFSLPICLFSQTQDVHFIHGLNANAGTWQDVATLLGPCGVTTTNGNYNDQQGGPMMAADINSLLANTSTNNGIGSSDDFCIAHSWGGLTLRDPLAGLGTNFGGYITVGSPHRGAGIANSVMPFSGVQGDPSVLSNQLDFACQTLVVDIVDAYENLVNVTGNAITLNLWDPNMDWLNNAFCDDGMGGGIVWEIVQLAGGNAGVATLTDISVGSNYVQTLGPAAHPSVAVIGIIPSPVHWNYLQDFTDLIDPIATPPITINGIQFSVLLNGFISVPQNVNQVYNVASVLSQFHLLAGIFTPNFLPNIRNAHLDLFEEFFGAIIWLDNSEALWLQLIGAGGNVISVQVAGPSWDISTHCDCWCDGQPVQCIGFDNPCGVQEPSAPEDECSNSAPDPNNPCWIFTPAQFIDVVVDFDDSDGFIPASSQNLAGAFGIEFINASHNAEPTSGEMLDVINRNMDPLTSVDPIFEIPGCVIQ